MTSDELEPVDPQLARLLDPARAPEPVSPARRRRIRQRLEADVGALQAEPSSRDRRWLVALVVAAAVAAVVLLVARSSASTDTGTARSIAERRSVKVGDRGIAVLEPGSDVSWSITSAGASVDQTRGRVFYRVEPGDAYVVRTPAGDVRVTGTSFEVELIMNTNKQRLKSMSLGAALATTAVVTVYEGRVVLANEHGRTELAAGQSATADAEHPPSSPRSRISPVRAAAPSRHAVAAKTAFDPVLVSDLRARIRELEGQLERSAGENEASDEPTDEEQIEFLSRMFNPSPAQLLEAAKNCELSYATPTAYPDGRYLSPAAVEKIGLEPDEVESLRRSLDGSRDRWVERSCST
ncbi:MAG: FecR domain-containing protein, partial [Myxococcota bacterium]